MVASAALVAGCTSDAGKSILVAGLCRLLRRKGVSVAPFKAQNMSNNCAVTADGGEIGRAQALQAIACDLPLSVDFNPVLLKPNSDQTSQVVVRGKADGNVSAMDYRSRRKALREVVGETLADMRERYDVVLCEGAGSPAEVNLRESDIANMGLAEIADLPVVVVGDIDRGGVLAHFVGTHQILAPADRDRISGFIVNKFRGSTDLLTPGLSVVEQYTTVPVLGVVPFINGLWIDAEDSLGTVSGASVGPATQPVGSQSMRIAVLRLPRVSNATDIEAFAVEPGVHVSWTVDPTVAAGADVVVIPGSKSTIADLAWLRQHGFAEVLAERARNGKPILGICGGFQMLCENIADEVESGIGSAVGLGLLDVDIDFAKHKTLRAHDDGSYEVHYGAVTRCNERPFLIEEGEGARRGAVMGTHRHGYFENDACRRAFLAEMAQLAGLSDFVVSSDTSFSAERIRQIDLIADVVDAAIPGEALAAATGIDQFA